MFPLGMKVATRLDIFSTTSQKTVSSHKNHAPENHTPEQDVHNVQTQHDGKCSLKNLRKNTTFILRLISAD
jgi:hypothetical protein